MFSMCENSRCASDCWIYCHPQLSMRHQTLIVLLASPKPNWMSHSSLQEIVDDFVKFNTSVNLERGLRQPMLKRLY